ncbi:MAG: DnaJ domain-containing protein [Putridiphycobacter sp.]
MFLAVFAIFLLLAVIARFAWVDKPADFFVKQKDKILYFDLLMIAAAVVKIDGNKTKKELDFIYWYFENVYGKSERKKAEKIINANINKDIRLKRYLNYLSENITFRERFQMLNFFAKITTVDNLLTDKEYEILTEITLGFGLSPNVLESILGNHSFITEEQREQAKQSKKTAKRSHSKLKLAYATLGVAEGCDSSEIKKAYRKLVQLYHPDKLIEDNPLYAEQAKASYLKVNDAYDYLKEKLGFK